MLADPNVVKVLHGAAYDLASMKRDFAFEIRGLFDTMVAAQFLGLPEVGLAALLKGILGIESGESRQKDDWAVRPLSAAQEHYAAEDVRHLFMLRARLMDPLAACGRAGWVEEECRALEGTPAADRVFHPDDCLAIKGVRILDRRGLAILRELFVAREAWAHERGRPPFKVLGNETLLRVAVARPETRDALARIPGCTPTVLARYGDGVLQAVARGLAVPATDLPILAAARQTAPGAGRRATHRRPAGVAGGRRAPRGLGSGPLAAAAIDRAAGAARPGRSAGA